MNIEQFDFVAWVVIPVLVFLARLVDVSLATLRHILIFRGMKRVVPFFAFIEILVWTLAITQVMENLSNVAALFAWALGFSAGTYLGMLIEERLALGHQLVRVIHQKMPVDFVKSLNEKGYGITSLGAHGAFGQVDVSLIVSPRKRLGQLLKMLNAMAPQPFYTVEDVRSVGASVFAAPHQGGFVADGGVKKK
ncbi:MAG TPA: hypothetical protein DEA90_15970 [Opitutae bacterium]|nr:hypothetical protein [Puniceicoccaceae bacterium]HBR95656.1 hypothetical protein [Opitutae bacterium]|tara:strand:+ start:14789 stop:15367 length:579 start_codon:yes stop_codon:yes gene_type:complete